MGSNLERLAVTSIGSFRYRADDAAKRAVELITEGAYAAAITAVADAMRYDAIAKEYEFIVESKVMEEKL